MISTRQSLIDTAADAVEQCKVLGMTHDRKVEVLLTGLIAAVLSLHNAAGDD